MPAIYPIANPRRPHKWLALLLAGLIALTTVPVSIFHYHRHTEHTCHQQHTSPETDICHTSIYHKNSAHQSCRHAHLLPAANECSFCKFLSRHTNYHYLLPTGNSSVQQTIFKPCFFHPKKDAVCYKNIAFSNKSPPVQPA